MSALRDEIVLIADCHIRHDPARFLRGKANKFIESRNWITSSVFYRDQSEPDNPEFQWSFVFCLGLDHIRTANLNWFDDVQAIIGFLQEVADEEDAQVRVELRWTSKLWYSVFITEVGERTNSFATIREMIENAI